MRSARSAPAGPRAGRRRAAEAHVEQGARVVHRGPADPADPGQPQQQRGGQRRLVERGQHHGLGRTASSAIRSASAVDVVRAAPAAGRARTQGAAPDQHLGDAGQQPRPPAAPARPAQQRHLGAGGDRPHRGAGQQHVAGAVQARRPAPARVTAGCLASSVVDRGRQVGAAPPARRAISSRAGHRRSARARRRRRPPARPRRRRRCRRSRRSACGCTPELRARRRAACPGAACGTRQPSVGGVRADLPDVERAEQLARPRR